jgi:hypothetical protein
MSKFVVYEDTEEEIAARSIMKKVYRSNQVVDKENLVTEKAKSNKIMRAKAKKNKKNALKDITFMYIKDKPVATKLDIIIR